MRITALSYYKSMRSLRYYLGKILNISGNILRSLLERHRPGSPIGPRSPFSPVTCHKMSQMSKDNKNVTNVTRYAQAFSGTLGPTFNIMQLHSVPQTLVLI